MTDSPTRDIGRQRRHYRLLYRLEEWLEPIMFLLAFVWLWLFIEELVDGLSPRQQLAVSAIWIIFIIEFLLKLYLAPRRLNYAARNWITVIALAVPAFRVFRLLGALRVLSVARVASSARLVRALTSTTRAYKALKAAQGPEPEPEMNVAILAAVSRDGDTPEIERFMQQVAGDVRAEMEGATQLRWVFHTVEPSTLDSDTARPPADFLEGASLRMAEGPYDLVLVVTDVGLVSRRKQMVAGLASPTSRIAVISTRKLLTTPRGQPACRLDAEPVRWNAGALLLHLLGHIGGLKHAKPGSSEIMAPFVFRETRRSVPGFSERERDKLARIGSRMPERELRGGHAVAALIFHVLMAFRHPLSVLKPLLRNRAPLLPLSLPSLATAAVAPGFLLVFTAEIWDVGLGMSNAVAILYAVISVLAASFYLASAQSLFLPRKEKRVLTEHLAVANSVIFLSILLACIGLFLMVGVLMLLIELYIFPSDLVQTWPTLNQPEVVFGDKLRLAAFISTVGVTTGALAGGLESRTVIQNLALFEDEQ